MPDAKYLLGFWSRNVCGLTVVFHCSSEGRPYIILKWAQTIDGFVDTNRNGHELGVPNWITNEIARVAVHRQRSTENAILIGTTTALRDNLRLPFAIGMAS